MHALIYVALLAGVFFGVFFLVFCFGFLLEMSFLFLVPPVVFLFYASFLGQIVCPRLKGLSKHLK